MSEQEKQTVGEYTHGLYLGKRWNDRAQANIEKWGNQSPGLLFLALVEELGEIAEQMLEESNVRPPKDGEHGPWTESWRFINDTRRLGLDARDFLESNFDEPAGTSDFTLPADLKILAPFNDPEAVIEEVEDSAPLLFQMYWALERDGQK